MKEAPDSGHELPGKPEPRHVYPIAQRQGPKEPWVRGVGQVSSANQGGTRVQQYQQQQDPMGLAMGVIWLWWAHFPLFLPSVKPALRL